MSADIVGSGDDALAFRYPGQVQMGARPALLLVDFTWEFLNAPEMAGAVASHPDVAVAAANRLALAARARGIPVVWTRNTVESPHGRESWTWTLNPAVSPHPRAGEIRDDLAVADEDFVVNKTKPSGFFLTPLLAFLVARGVDTLIVGGGTTSGCVRATVVDGFSYNYRVGLAADACFDRDEESHRVSLKDLGAKYARVAPADEFCDWLSTAGNKD